MTGSDPSHTQRRSAPRVLYREAALADGRSPRLVGPVSVLVEDGRVAAIWHGEPDIAALRDSVVIDASGATIVPGLVDLHGHLALSSGARYRERLERDPPETLLQVAEENGADLMAAGVRWVRDAGSPTHALDGAPPRPLAVTIRERWRGRADRPAVRAAGTWITCPGYLGTAGADAADGSALPAVALGQLEAGADLVKLYLEGPTQPECPWTAAEVRRAVDAVHAEGATVAAHAETAAATRVAAHAGVDTLEHGFALEPEIARTMAANGTALVTTLGVMRVQLDFLDVAPWVDRYAAFAQLLRQELESGLESVRTACEAGVTVVAGSDFGGGSVRPGHLAMELELLVEAGMAPADALAAATWRAGEVLGVPGAGCVRVGDPATFFLVQGDPLADPAALWRVWLRP